MECFVEDLYAEGLRKVARRTRWRTEHCVAQNGRESLSTYCDVHGKATKVEDGENKMSKHFHSYHVCFISMHSIYSS